MPAPLTVRWLRPNNGIQQVLLSLDLGQPNDVLINATREVLAAIFGEELREGDIWALEGRLLKRAGTNGLNKA